MKLTGSTTCPCAASAQAALGTALDALTRLLAPTLPFASEEAWSWWHERSVHAATWPVPAGVTDPGLDLDAVSEVLQRVRRAKTEAKRSQRSEVARVVVGAPAAAQPALEAAAADLTDALTIGELAIEPADAIGVAVELG